MSLDSKLLLILTKRHMLLFDQKNLVRDSMLVEKKCRPIISLKLEAKLYERKLCGLGTTQTELDLNLSSVSS